jgi:hypothetical protein
MPMRILPAQPSDAEPALVESTPGLSIERDGWLQLRVAQVLRESVTVVSVEAARDDGARLPSWEQGRAAEEAALASMRC